MKRRQPKLIRMIFAAALLCVLATAIFGERLPIKIYTELAVSGENLTLEISDGGGGFELRTADDWKLNLFASKDETGGNGVLSMRKRAAEMEGTIEIVSECGKGTSILLNLPLHPTAQMGSDFAR